MARREWSRSGRGSGSGAYVGFILGGAAGVVVSELIVDSMMIRLTASQELVGSYLRLAPSTNDGIAFGLLQGTGVLPIVLAVFALILIARFAWDSRGSRMMGLAIGLLAGGAAANVLERLQAGAVLDYVDLGIGDARWPTFNVADIGISAAFLLLIGFAMFGSSGRDAADGGGPADQPRNHEP